MSSNSGALQKASLQQGDDLEVWVTGARIPQKQIPLAGGHRVKEEVEKDDNLDLNRNHGLGVDRLLPVKVEPEELNGAVQGIGVIGSTSQLRPLQEHSRKGKEQLDCNRQQTPKATEPNLSTAIHGRSPQPSLEPSSSHPPAAAPGSDPEESNKADRDDARQGIQDWEEMRRRSLIVTHPLYPELLARHAACLRVVAPADQIPALEAQLIQAPQVTEPYRVLGSQIINASPEEQAALDQMMREYPLSLRSVEQTLHHHVETSVTEAMTACWEIEQELFNLTGARPGPGYGATMSDDDYEYHDSDGSSDQQEMDVPGNGKTPPCGPPEPLCDSERTVMERIRQQLKVEFKQGYISKITAVQEEIMRKRSAGKLPEGTTEILKQWWDAHAQWPYPTEEEKESLIEQTNLKLKQINNWFINKRKRDWTCEPGQMANRKGKARKR